MQKKLENETESERKTVTERGDILQKQTHCELAGQRPEIRISVRNLVEFVLRSGDIDNRRGAFGEKDAMQAGSRMHRKIQKRMGANYQAEVSLRCKIREGDFAIVVEGRADGILTEPSGVTIDEIKGVYRDLRLLEAPDELHLAQAMCYGYMYGIQQNLSSVVVQVTYCNLETEEIRRFQIEKTYEELKLWFQGMIHDYIKWARYLYHHGVRRDQSLKEMKFPYAYRSGQRELAASVYRSIVRERNLFVQAPTGVGKTLSTLYPALKAIGEGYADKLFYLTAKTITCKVAEEAFAVLGERNLYFNRITITAKEKLCFLDQPQCNPDACPYAKGHYDRINEAVFDIIHGEMAVTRDKILDYAARYQVCPFEFCLDVSNWVDGVICDYNYVFDPTVRLKRYFSEAVSDKYLFLVDEAHNLVPRAREMFSAQLIKEDGMALKRMFKGKELKLVRMLDKVNRTLLEMKREPADEKFGHLMLDGISDLALTLISLMGELENWLEQDGSLMGNRTWNDAHEYEMDRDAVLDYYFNLRKFLYVFERLDVRYRIYARVLEDGRFMLRLFCIDPSGNLKECLERGASTIFFSATLLPVMYYKKLLSGNLEDYAVYADSPFCGDHRLLMIGTDVSGRYNRRNRREYERVVEYLLKMTMARSGNYMAFFPSYAYLNQIEVLLEERRLDKKLDHELQWRAQKPDMTESDKEIFLQDFEQERAHSYLALCVLGGFFSEGIDLTEERLIGTAIVGTGLPMVCAEQAVLKNYFQDMEGRGFDYAYLYPGMNKVMQAAGRVIRTVRDKGVILLLDERFMKPEYQELFPREWDRYAPVTIKNVEEWLKHFWQNY